MSQTIACPACSAPLDLGDGSEPVVDCEYCDTPVAVPDELRDREPSSEPPAFASLPGQLAKLKELGRRVRASQPERAAELYAEIFGVEPQEAEEAVEKLSQGESVQVSSVVFPADSLLEAQLLAGTEQPRRRFPEWVGVLVAVGLAAVIFILIAAAVLIVARSLGAPGPQIPTESPLTQVLLTFGT